MGRRARARNGEERGSETRAGGACANVLLHLLYVFTSCSSPAGTNVQLL